MLLTVIFLGLIEGLTEFLPVSSTGHLVVASSLLHFDPAWREPFLIVIQLGAILAVVVDRWRSLLEILKSGRLVRFGMLLAVGFVPIAIAGLTLKKYISALLHAPAFVAAAWILGGIAIFFLDRPKPGEPAQVAEGSGAELVDQLTSKQAALVGLAQCLALWPGMSRSACTILGGLAVGLNRRAATLFSFYLAIPTMIAASGYDLFKHRKELEGAGMFIGLGMLVSFAIAWPTVRWMLRYVQTHTFRPFAGYRIIAGALILLMPAEWWS